MEKCSTDNHSSDCSCYMVIYGHYNLFFLDIHNSFWDKINEISISKNEFMITINAFKDIQSHAEFKDIRK